MALVLCQGALRQNKTKAFFVCRTDPSSVHLIISRIASDLNMCPKTIAMDQSLEDESPDAESRVNGLELASHTKFSRGTSNGDAN
jgi:hypothetical protein